MRGSAADAQVGVEVFDRNTGTVLTNVNENQLFPMMSVVKLMIALGVLDDNDWALPSPDTQQELTRMLAYSDDGIANDLWGSYGGPAIITAISEATGMQNTDPPTDTGEWGDTKTTAADIVALYQYIAEKLPAEDRDLILNALSNAPQTASDGTDQYFGIPRGIPNTPWAIKQGWGSSGNRIVVNTTGLVGGENRYVVVVLTSSLNNSESTLRSAITTGTMQLSALVS